MRVKLLKRAQNDIQLIKEFHPQKGKEIEIFLIQELQRLEEAPHLGANLSFLTKEPTDFRYFVMNKWLAFYKIQGADVKIYRIYDGRQDWLNKLRF